jgi:hypothetical protein
MESDGRLKKVCPQCDTTVHARRAVVYCDVIGSHALRKTSSKRSMSLRPHRKLQEHNIRLLED